MNFAKTLVFEVEAEWGHFRTFNTTSSPLSYPLPPRPALIGLVGAILGIERETSPGKIPVGGSVATLLSPAEVVFAVQLLNPVRKQTIAFNLLNTKNFRTYYNIDNRTQVPFELLKEPAYRIFAGFRNAELQENLEERIKSKNYHFQPYLGLSQFTANVTYLDTIDLKRVNRTAADEWIPITTAVNLSRLSHDPPPVKFDQEARYAADLYPYELSQDRVVQEYAELLVETTARRPIVARLPEYFASAAYGNISFL